jgi:hypothetical protein
MREIAFRNSIAAGAFLFLLGWLFRLLLYRLHNRIEVEFLDGANGGEEVLCIGLGKRTQNKDGYGEE